MAKRGYKLQEFVAHSGNVNCLRIGKKACRNFLTGGDDLTVNLWSIGKPEPLTSLSGHATPVESVAFDSTEVLVVAGASSGVIKLWDLEETKMVRTLTGHKSYCTAVEFHPFGEFFASGSMDTNLKIWDIRKKGCIHTYKGHTRGISTIRFTPDGRWVVSGGFDNVVKIWDLTAGKLLHDFKFHEGHIRSIDFHPLEFLLATGSADRTVKFWDLETFEMIGSARRETAGVRSITFHPDGRTLFCGLDDSLKVYSWEPVICHDSIDIGWSTLGDLCVHDGKILGGAYYQNSVGVWVADISLIEPYGACVRPEQSHELQENALPKSGSHRRSNSSVRSISPETDSGEIKNIYVDTAATNHINSRKAGVNAPTSIVPSDSNEIKNLQSQKQSPAAGVHAKPNNSTNTKSFIVPNVVPHDFPNAKDMAGSRRESLSSARGTSVPSFKPSHVRRLSNTKFDMEAISTALESGPLGNTTDPKREPNFKSRLNCDYNTKESSEEKHLDIKNKEGKSEITSLPTTPSDLRKCEKSQNAEKGGNSVKFVNGVAVVRGRTRSLVERFERRENFNSAEDNRPDIAPQSTNEAAKAPPVIAPQSRNEAAKASPFTSPQRTTEGALCSPFKAPQSMVEAGKMPPSPACQPVTGTEETSPLVNSDQQVAESEAPEKDDNFVIEILMQNHDVLLSTFRSRLTKLQMVRHFWERRDIKGAINAMRKLPDHSVQADVVNVLLERMEIITLDVFSCLLPVLVGLLDSKVERHSSLSLEMLLKLVAVFGPLVRSTVSAPPVVGVDLHAEERLQSCKQCFVHLQNIQKILPLLVRRGGVVARCAQELSLVLQQP